jgi:hypothetical protein
VGHRPSPQNGSRPGIGWFSLAIRRRVEFSIAPAIHSLVILTKWSPRRSRGLPRKDLCTRQRCRTCRVLTPEDRKLRSSLKRLDRCLASYGRKIVKKFVKSLAAFDVIQERLKRNPCPAKNRSATQNLRVTRDDAIYRSHRTLLSTTSQSLLQSRVPAKQRGPTAPGLLPRLLSRFSQHKLRAALPETVTPRHRTAPIASV